MLFFDPILVADSRPSVDVLDPGIAGDVHKCLRFSVGASGPPNILMQTTATQSRINTEQLFPKDMGSVVYVSRVVYLMVSPITPRDDHRSSTRCLSVTWQNSNKGFHLSCRDNRALGPKIPSVTETQYFQKAPDIWKTPSNTQLLLT